MQILSKRAQELIYIFNEQKLLILKELFICKHDICGCDLVEKISISKDLLSYHIKTLREKGFIDELKCGRNKKYTINSRRIGLIEEVLKLADLI